MKVCWEGKGMEFSGGPVVTGTAMSLLWCGFDPLASEILHAVGAAKKKGLENEDHEPEGMNRQSG